MRTFPGWRAVGRAMLDARRREGVSVERPKRVGVVIIRTYRGPADAVVQVKHYQQAAWFKTFSGITGSTNVYPNSAGEALRVLAALDLIPAHLADGPDERYGRCEVPGCRLLAEWWPVEAEAEPRWVHVEPWLVTDHHRPEVAS